MSSSACETTRPSTSCMAMMPRHAGPPTSPPACRRARSSRAEHDQIWHLRTPPHHSNRQQPADHHSRRRKQGRGAATAHYHAEQEQRDTATPMLSFVNCYHESLVTWLLEKNYALYTPNCKCWLYQWAIFFVHSGHVISMCRVFDDLQRRPRHAGAVTLEDFIFCGAP
jgi:hypothetical protein